MDRRSDRTRPPRLPAGRAGRVRVKICGITSPDAARAAAEAGADAIGLVFAESPRRISVAEAACIVEALPPWVAPVGVFVDAAAAEVRRIAADIGLAAVQLHGDEPPRDLARLRRGYGDLAELGRLKVIKVFAVASERDLETARAWRTDAEAGRPPDAWLLDAGVPGGPKGGTGRTADWTLAARMADEGFWPLILAGGLGPENVAEAIRAVQPWAVDGSSALESSPGQKSPEKIRDFISAVRCAESCPL